MELVDGYRIQLTMLLKQATVPLFDYASGLQDGAGLSVYRRFGCGSLD